MTAPPPSPPGWYPDPSGTGRRYWDGQQWGAHESEAPPPPPRSPTSGAGWKVALGVLLGLVILIVGCAAIIGAGMEAGGGNEDTGLEESGSGGTEEPRSAQRTRRFSGNGSKNIGTVKVTDDAVMEWTHRPDGEAILGFTAYDRTST